jgi:hypothetical protein
MNAENETKPSYLKIEQLLQKHEASAKRCEADFARYQDVLNFREYCEKSFGMFGAVAGELQGRLTNQHEEMVFSLMKRMLDMHQKSLVVAIYNLSFKSHLRFEHTREVRNDPDFDAFKSQIEKGGPSHPAASKDEPLARSQTKEHWQAQAGPPTLKKQETERLAKRTLLQDRSTRKVANSSVMIESQDQNDTFFQKPRGALLSPLMRDKSAFRKIYFNTLLTDSQGRDACQCNCHFEDMMMTDVNVQGSNHIKYDFEESIGGSNTITVANTDFEKARRNEQTIQIEAERLIDSLNTGRGYTRAAKANPMIVVRASEILANELDQSLVKGLAQIQKEISESQFFVRKEGNSNLIIQNLQKLVEGNAVRVKEEIDFPLPPSMEGRSVGEVEDELMDHVRQHMVSAIKKMSKNVMSVHRDYLVSQSTMTVMTNAEWEEKEGAMAARLEANEREIHDLIVKSEAQKLQVDFLESVNKDANSQLKIVQEAEQILQEQMKVSACKLNEADRNNKRLVEKQGRLEQEVRRFQNLLVRLTRFFYQMHNVFISEITLRAGHRAGLEALMSKPSVEGVNYESALQVGANFMIKLLNQATGNRYPHPGLIPGGPGPGKLDDGQPVGSDPSQLRGCASAGLPQKTNSPGGKNGGGGADEADPAGTDHGPARPGRGQEPVQVIPG